MAYVSRRALGSKQIREQLHDDSVSYSEIRQDADIHITEHNDSDCKISRNSDDGQGIANVSDDESGGGDNDEDDDNEDWVLGQNDHDFCKIKFGASGCNPPRNGQMPDFLNEFYSAIFSAHLF
jgi:hypothetical protein